MSRSVRSALRTDPNAYAHIGLTVAVEPLFNSLVGVANQSDVADLRRVLQRTDALARMCPNQTKRTIKMIEDSY
jgi:hypothetical protein